MSDGKGGNEAATAGDEDGAAEPQVSELGGFGGWPQHQRSNRQRRTAFFLFLESQWETVRGRNSTSDRKTLVGGCSLCRTLKRPASEL